MYGYLRPGMHIFPNLTQCAIFVIQGIPLDRVYHDKSHSHNIDRLHGEIFYAQSFVKLFNFSKINAVHINKLHHSAFPLITLQNRIKKNTLLKMTTCTRLI